MEQEKGGGGAWAALIGVSIAGFAMYAPMLCVPPVIHIIKDQLRLSHAQVGLIFTIPLIALAVCAVPGGALADRYGVRKATMFGLIIIIAGSLLRSTSQTFTSLLVFSFIYGIGFGFVYPTLPKLVAAVFPAEKIGLATGIYAAGINAGCALPMAVSLPLVYPLTQTFQGVMIFWTLPAILAAILWLFLTKGISATRGNSVRSGEGAGISYLIWSNSTMWLIALMFFVVNFAMYAWSGWTPRLLVEKGASPSVAAMMTSIIVWVAIPVTFFAPWASDKIGLRKPFLWSAFALLGLVCISAIWAPLSFGWSINGAIGLALSVPFAVLLALPPELLPAEGVGRASGMMLFVGYVGGLLGPWIGGYTVDITGGFQAQLLTLACLAAFAVCLAFLLPETGRRARKK